MKKPATESMPVPTESSTPEKRGWLEDVFEVGKQLIFAILLFFLVDSVIDRVRVENISMIPTFQEGEMLFVNKLAYRFGSVERGDIVTFHYPLDPKLSFIKRAIGLPGDVVEIENGQVRVNGMMLNEPYIVSPANYHGEWTVPADSLFVLGDNRADSADSHVWGFVPTSNLVGKVLMVYWPLDHIHIVTHADLMAPASP
jgi:signal peptidase I